MNNKVGSLKVNENLYKCSVIWLDASANSSQENINAQKQLRTSVNNLLIFEDDKQCLQHIHSMSKNDRIILIVSGRLGRIIVPKIAQLQQIISIYVYCQDKKANEQWAKQFSKVKDVIVRLDDLFDQIQSDRKQIKHHKIDEEIPICAFNSNILIEEHSSTELNGQFIHFQLLIDCLIRMKPSLNEKQEFISYLKEKFEKNSDNFKIVEEFERNYSSDQSITWYTRETFLYKMLNKALRVQDIKLLYLFRFFIRDLAQQLEKNKCSSIVRVYRGQKMSKKEIEMFQNSVGQFISMNSFLSTSLKSEIAENFISNNSSDDNKNVLFKIDADSRLKNIKAFSNITTFNDYGEEEILFMIGSIFQVIEIKRDNNRIWNIRLRLCSNNDDKLQSLFEYMRKKLGNGETNLYIFAGVLHDMGKLDYAEKYYRYYLKQLPDKHPHISACYHALGIVTSEKKDFKSSLTWYNKLLEIINRTLENDDANIANIYNSSAIVYQEIGDHNQAIESYKKALIIWKKTYGEEHPDVAMCLSNLGNVYQDQKKYLKALECHQKALTIHQNHLPVHHPHIGTSHNNIGNSYVCLDQYDLALKHYTSSLKIYEKSLPPSHLHFAMTYENIGLIYEHLDDFEKALFNFKKASKIFSDSLPATNPNVIRIEQNVDRISSKLTSTYF
ncbi:unnamed protein product [Rotaria sordida]|uniref:NAD(P)(+)--arginine ADP-ribosyltransferase n=1 Tax=Rotaria sordida TaxID=392033 RepID=A0A818IWY8_9BILA|nr:unnamed protein product [Rotaria sordida]CAF3529819.1 unnamed protein product [Rotaria sordida]